jgi:hypothetical protein
MSKARRIILRTVAALLIFVALAAFIWFSPYSPYQYGHYIPADLDDAHAYLQKHLPAEELQRIRDMKSEEDMIDYHMGLGMGMRNGWALWAGSRLSRHFNKLGVHHPDDMSGIILDTFWCRVHNQPLRLTERVAYYQAYCREPQFLRTCALPTERQSSSTLLTTESPKPIHARSMSARAPTVLFGLRARQGT